MSILASKWIRFAVCIGLLVILWLVAKNTEDFIAITVPIAISLLLNDLSYKAENYKVQAATAAQVAKTVKLQVQSNNSQIVTPISGSWSASSDEEVYLWLLNNNIIDSNQYKYLANKKT